MKFFAVPAVLLGLSASALAKPGVSFWSSKLMARATTDPTVTYPLTDYLVVAGGGVNGRYVDLDTSSAQ